MERRTGGYEMLDMESSESNMPNGDGTEVNTDQDVAAEAQGGTEKPVNENKGDAEADGAGRDKPDGDGEACGGKEGNGSDEKDDKKRGHKPEKDIAEELKKLVAEKTDRLQRTMAEFDNFRKRTEKEKDARFGMGERNVIEKILPVIDSFERGFAGLDEAAKEDPFVKGMDQVYKQLMGILGDMGVKEIPALGEKFNPDLHNAVMHVEDENLGENEIAEVFSKGYSYKGTVVRFSMVKVAN
jgi:molecular chaperone GrpE